MAIGIYFDGRRLIRPQAVTKIDDTGMYARGLAGANVLAIVGEATGGQPKTVQWFTDPSYAKAILRSGPLLQAIQRAYDPSAEVSGAYMVAAIRVNPATQSSLILKDSSFNPLIVLTSVDYGLWNNQIKVRIETGTSYGKKATVTYGTSFDQGDNIRRQSIFLGCADPQARTATYSVSKATGKLLTSVISNLQRVLYFTGATSVFSEAPTLQAKELDSIYFSVGLVGTGSPPNDYLYFGSDQPFRQIPFNKGATANVQDVVSTLSGQYWTGTAWASLAGFTDGTKGGANKPFSTNGDITFTLPTNWAKTALTAVMFPGATIPSIDQTTPQYWIRVSANNSLTVAGEGDQLTITRGLDVTLSQYPTIQELIDYLDAQPHYEVGAVTTKPDSELSAELDDVSGDMITGMGNTVISAGGYDPSVNGTTLPVDSTTNFAIGDYISVTTLTGNLEESRRVTGIGTGTLTMDSPLSDDYSAGSKVREASILNSDLQALIEWFNNYSAYVTAAYSGSAVNRAQVANIGDTYLIGGGEGVVTQSDWDECIGKLQTEDVHLITCVSVEPAVWASLSAHCSYMSTVGKKERIGFCGGFSTDDGYADGLGKWNSTVNINASINQMLIYAQQLNTDRMVYVGPGFSSYDENGNLTTYNGAIAGALVSGMASGVDVAEALTHRSIKCIGLEYNFKWADLDRLLEGGVCPLEYDPGHGYRVCQSITTWLRNDKYNRRELSVRRTADYVARQVRERLERDFVGSKGTKTTLISIKNATISVLTQMVRLELLAGDAQNPPFKNIQCRLEGDVCYVDFECSPVIPINYIPITIHLTVFTTTLTA